MKLRYPQRDMIASGLIYAIGDTTAALMLDQFSLTRMLGMMIVGATIYAFEIVNYFRWIDEKTPASHPPGKRAFYRTLLALLFFNPLWIARHLLFIRLCSTGLADVSWDLMRIGFFSFLVNIPIAAVGNYIIQVKVPLARRFPASAIFSALLAIYYALSEVMF